MISFIIIIVFPRYLNQICFIGPMVLTKQCLRLHNVITASEIGHTQDRPLIVA